MKFILGSAGQRESSSRTSQTFIKSPGDLITNANILQGWAGLGLSFFMVQYLPGAAALTSTDKMISWDVSSSNTTAITLSLWLLHRKDKPRQNPSDTEL